MLKTDYLAFRGILEKKILNWLGCFWVFSFFVLQLGGQDLNVLHLAKVTYSISLRGGEIVTPRL